MPELASGSTESIAALPLQLIGEPSGCSTITTAQLHRWREATAMSGGRQRAEMVTVLTSGSVGSRRRRRTRIALAKRQAVKVGSTPRTELDCIVSQALCPSDYMPKYLMYYWSERASRTVDTYKEDNEDDVPGKEAAEQQPNPEIAKLQEQLKELDSEAEICTKYDAAIPAKLQKQINDAKEKIDEGRGVQDQRRRSDQGRVFQQKHNKAQAELRSANKEKTDIEEKLRLALHGVQELESSAKVAEKKVAEKRLADKETAVEVSLFHDEAPASDDGH